MSADPVAILDSLVKLEGWLAAVEFKTLKRPQAKGDTRTEKEVRWALRVYIGTAFYLFRDMLRAYVMMLRENNQAGALLVVRMLLELAAQGSYIAQKMQEPLKAGDSNACWEVLSQANVGSIHLRRHSEERKTLRKEGRERLEPIQTEAALRALNRELANDAPDLRGAVFEKYSLLSEHSHPDAMALRQYVTLDRAKMTASFHPTKYQPQASIFDADIYVLIWLRKAAQIMSLAELHTPRRKMEDCCNRFFALKSA
jgi:hypothetical protein